MTACCLSNGTFKDYTIPCLLLVVTKDLFRDVVGRILNVDRRGTVGCFTAFSGCRGVKGTDAW